MTRTLAEILAGANRHRARVKGAKLRKHACPACGHRGRCDVSEHLFFVEDRLGLRCRECRHVWMSGE